MRSLAHRWIAGGAALLVTAASGCQGDGGSAGGLAAPTVPGIRVSLSAGSLTVMQGDTGAVTTTVTRMNGFNGDVDLMLEGVPDGVTATCTPWKIASGSTSGALNLAIGSAVAPGTYALTIRGRGAGVADYTLTFSLTVSVYSGAVRWAMLTAAPGPYGHTCGVTEVGTAYCWGNNWYGALGSGSDQPSRRPVRVTGTVQFRQVAAGWQHTCGLAVDGRAFCWGKGSVEDVPSGAPYLGPPVPVAGAITFSSLGADVNSTCGVSLGVGYCWATIPGFVPVQIPVPGGAAIRAISRDCGLDGGGGVWCWRWNYYSGEFLTTRVPGGFSFATISTGDYRACGITADGSAYCWGDNANGELGTDSHVIFSDVPLPVSGGLHFKSIAVGDDHSCAITLAGEAYCWGYNNLGQLGNGPDTARTRQPVRVSSNRVFRDVVAGPWYSCAIAQDGTAYCWGNNCDGQLGDGSSATCNMLNWQFSRVPVRVRDP